MPTLSSVPSWGLDAELPRWQSHLSLLSKMVAIVQSRCWNLPPGLHNHRSGTEALVLGSPSWTVQKGVGGLGYWSPKRHTLSSWPASP